MSRAVVICGVPPVRSIGAGRLAIELARQAATRPDVRLLFAGNRSAVADAVRRRRWPAAASATLLHVARRIRQRVLAAGRSLVDAESLILLHPQSVGGGWCLDLIRRRRHPTWIYLLDSSFFCVRSYNHLRDEHDACTRCLAGRWTEAGAHGCKPYPAGHDCGLGFLDDLRRLAAEGRVRFMAQNPGQAALARQHFGEPWDVPVAGMWTIDLAEVFDTESEPPLAGRGPDVVFHGGDHPAKGLLWALDVARRLAAVRFLFPMAWRGHPAWGERPANCEFTPMTWESGLEQAVASAPVTLVPSLWSAPVEGALVKSIVVGRAVVAPRIETGFIADLPDGLVRLVDRDPAVAATQLADAIASGWRPESAVLSSWKRSFRDANAPLLATMLRAAATVPPRSS